MFTVFTDQVYGGLKGHCRVPLVLEMGTVAVVLHPHDAAVELVDTLDSVIPRGDPDKVADVKVERIVQETTHSVAELESEMRCVIDELRDGQVVVTVPLLMCRGR